MRTAPSASPCHSESTFENSRHSASSQFTIPVRLLSAASHASWRVSCLWSSASAHDGTIAAFRTNLSTSLFSGASNARHLAHQRLPSFRRSG